jgi:hypothetical protein
MNADTYHSNVYLLAAASTVVLGGSSYLCASAWLWMYYNAHKFRLPSLNYARRKVGGITFIRLGRLRFSFCIAKP